MRNKQELAQWVIDNRYAKSENEKVSDKEIYDTIVDFIQSEQDKNDKASKLYMDICLYLFGVIEKLKANGND